MLEKYLNLNSYSDEYSVTDWNELIENSFRKYFTSETIFLRNKDILRTEIINYCVISTSEQYLKLFENTIDYFNDFKMKSKSDFYNLLALHFLKVSETDLKWTGYSLTQQETTTLSVRDILTLKFKMMEDILEGCFKERFKLFYHIINIDYTDNLDFGEYISNFNDDNSKFNLYLKDPLFSIKTSQWRNIAAHKTYEISKERIKIKYGKKIIKEVDISHAQLDVILEWIKFSYISLRLSQVITYLVNPEIFRIINTQGFNIPIRFESWLLTIIHNLQIVGFPFVKVVEENEILNIILKKRKDADVKESVIHASQCLDQLSSAVFADEFTQEKYHIAKVTIVSETLENLGSASVSIKEMHEMRVNNKSIDYEKEMVELVKFSIDGINYF